MRKMNDLYRIFVETLLATVIPIGVTFLLLAFCPIWVTLLFLIVSLIVLVKCL